MSKAHCVLTLSPAGLRLRVATGARLQDVLFAQGVEFPCGGRGRCKGCRVRVLKGALPPVDAEEKLLTSAELRDGWRLACQHMIEHDLELELAQWEMAVLEDQSSFSFTPGEGLGIAIDLGTTTLAAQLLDLATGNVLAVNTALNAQAPHGSDIMSRVDYALHGGQAELKQLVRQQLGAMTAELVAGIGHDAAALTRVVIVGNSVMHHLFCGIDITPLSAYPFRPTQPGRVRLSPGQLHWRLPASTVIEFLPCPGGFVGSDILAGVVATGLAEARELTALMDLGTNGEVVVGNRDRMVCASTAAGPAFEGARISMGMRAATGAISEVTIENDRLHCRVIGNDEARGLCGSGLVDAAAGGLALGWILPSGRMMCGPAMPLCGAVSLLPTDVRELQLAKGAIAAGLRILTRRLGASVADIRQLHLAGAFGNYINRRSAERIGLVRVPRDRVVPAGNTALRGAKRALFEDPAKWDALAKRIEHVALHEDPEFQEIYAEEMAFPAVS